MILDCPILRGRSSFFAILFNDCDFAIFLTAEYVLNPFLASNTDVSNPMPPEPPVTKATFSRTGIFHSLYLLNINKVKSDEINIVRRLIIGPAWVFPLMGLLERNVCNTLLTLSGYYMNNA
jgi:hypothetical protein